MSLFISRKRTGKSLPKSPVRDGPESMLSVNSDKDHQQGGSTSNSPDNALGTSHISKSDFNRRSRDILELYRDLRELGAQVFVDSVPRISVIGCQSAGKSSLVEAVSGINVPRDSGTCTRCPMELSMTQDNTWSCKISLRLEYDANGDRYPSLQSEQFGPTLTDKAEVEIWLRRAQAAILSPHLTSSQFYDKSREDLADMRDTDSRVHPFSKNMIHIDVKDPEVTGLLFVDLPGLIQNSDTPGLIDLVKDLVVSNIAGDNTLILIAIPMGDDIENQQAVRLAKEVDPTGRRTIGVLTKPDVVLPSSIGQLNRWRSVLEGDAFPLQLGYYCVRLPDEAERMKQLPRVESERLADAFFRTHNPWSQMTLRSRFGIPNLVHDVSSLLVEWIESNLPALKKRLNELLDKCRNELNALPPSLDPSIEILLRLGEFRRAFNDAVCATEEKSMVQRARKRYREYKIDILRTTPNFWPFYDCAKYRTLEDGPTSDQDLPDSYQIQPMDLRYVRQVIQDSVGWELPGHTPFAATKHLVLKSTSLWKQPSMACFNDIYELTAETINSLVRQHFSRFPKAESHIRSLANAELEQCKLDALHSVEKILKSETEPLFTQNTHYFETEQRKWYDHYYRQYHVIRDRLEIPPSPSSERACSVASFDWEMEQRLAVEQEREVLTLRALPIDGYAEELRLMSRVHAYFRIAFKRIIDILPLTIEHSLNHTLNSTLHENFLEKLMRTPNYTQKMAELAEEDADVVEKRHVLSERIERLLQIKRRLDC
ncbi:hypothetical protein M378DRAFT_111256 [Amanita muscaria Koide BX008]|uniref:P-loop containing nucleoside triphosphate hydrolase protein n=1 Tax=Amanita muscaria (strain Koide BX008) TaxID=946122 RepID=A0A0C2WR38_AMAMK|nr:hypothetical protein M378DRAFT_111256 [Amanita muscaria Koide BX008]